MMSSRAAAISIASGSLSSLSQIAATGSRLGEATLNPGTTSRARASKRRSASGSPSEDTGQRTSPGTPRGSAGGEDGELRTALQKCVGERGALGDEVLAVVEDEQHPAW